MHRVNEVTAETSDRAQPLTFVVTGPTCGGKTGCSASLARRFGLPIWSLDSMKVYRGLDVGTAKPSREMQKELQFELLNLREPWERFSASDYIEEWTKLARASDEPRIVSGGTVFYLNTLREGLFTGPGPNEEVRSRLAREAEERGLPKLHTRLREVDPVAASKIHETDLRRTVRALEVFEVSGEPISVWHARRTPILDPRRTLYLGVFRPREELYGRIDSRVIRMYEQGWVEEVERLLEAHDPPWGTEAAQSIGYERIRRALTEGRDPRKELERIQSRTRGLARNQLTWARKFPIEWWTPEEADELADGIASAIELDLRPEPDLARRARSTLL